MINVDRVLQRSPRFQRFASVKEISHFAESLKKSPGFKVRKIGRSPTGHPIHHVCFGAGKIKALFGGLTTLSLMRLLRDGNRELIDADVEWHIVPCADPDGAMLNEGWSLKPFSFSRFMQFYFRLS